MRVVHTEAALLNAVNLTRQEALAAFGNATVYMEKFLENPAPHRNPGAGRRAQERGVPRRARLFDAAAPPEDHRGGAGTRSHGKQRDRIGERCAEACRKIGYRGAGTFEFLYEGGEFYFIE
jgi:acetyl-CoA carboxylase biotin carboxylase subunit